jgi:hypothetical protein
MSDEEFLARWSRRKREASAAQALPQPDVPVEAKVPVPPAGRAAEHATAEVDLSNLPPLESIDAATDITSFLRKGIPQELSRAALRRAWTVDPAIRDFVGLAENAWDFNDPTAMPGFGPLDYSPEQLDALVRRIVGGVSQAAENLPDPPGVPEDAVKSAGPEPDLAQGADPVEAMVDLRTPDSMTTESHSASAAPRPPVAVQVESEETGVRRRTHGGALPR